ncbi:MAG: type II and III secretion system protein family protein [Desulfobacteraceae bacterium]|jgi:pilus assembly protein CpaC
MLKNPQVFYYSILFICCFFINIPAASAGSCNDYATSGCSIEIEMHKSFIKKTGRDITRISIANPDIADARVITPRQVLLIGNKPGSTNLIIWHKNNNKTDINPEEEEQAEVYDVEVYVSYAIMKAVHGSLRKMVPEAKVNIQRTAKGIILDGEVESQQMLERVLSIVRSYVDVMDHNNLITITGSQQVQLEVRIAEVSRSGLKQMGLGFLNNNDWSIGLFASGKATGSSSAMNSVTPPTITETIDPFGNYTKTTTTGGTTRNLSSGIDLSTPFGSAFQVVLHAVEDDSMAILSILKGQGLSRILASPTLVAMSGQEAEFMVGGEYPYPVQGFLGRTTIEYKHFGIMLIFTPTVVGKETISIQVQPEVSSLDYSSAVNSGGVAVPGLRTRKGSTTLQLKDGQTFAMAGLISEEVQSTLNKVPFLGDIPILGSLFTSKQYQRSETELVIIVTPRLVRAMNPNEVPPLPGEGDMDNISDADFFLKNRVSSPVKKANNKPDKNQEKTAPEFSGKTGFTR